MSQSMTSGKAMIQTAKQSLTTDTWIAAGYTQWPIPALAKDLNKNADFLLQKLVSDNLGKKYYITVYCYVREHFPAPMHQYMPEVSFTATAQFVPTDSEPFFDIIVNYANKILEAEQFFEKCWQMLGSPYYELSE